MPKSCFRTTGLKHRKPLRVVLFAALPQEYRSFLKRIPNRGRTGAFPCPAHEFRLPGILGWVLETGMGSRQARPILSSLAAAKPDALFSVGFCGALSSPMTVGQVVMGNEFSELGDAGELLFHASRTSTASGAINRFLTEQAIRPAHIVTVPRLRSKTELRFGPGRGLGVVDMESARWARWSVEQGIPFLCLRSVSDRLHQRIDYDLESLTDAAGRLQARKAAWAMLQHPDWVPQFHASWKRARVAATALSETLLGLLLLPGAELRAILHDLQSAA